ncbi:hypothetical protein SUGI_0568100 [Cryptomeria japonica]|uniref:probable disease resistance protein At4g27220 n=1 Tax=Cryptomeria japonica TaxID=3369 RepID=UPI002408C095|nr:probable disease resistance protein At4g27220 [Cryptomeria japonica]GLJ28821.1 hypothetical protein SUGI_0568100 [Cryptomeria japonica]
MGDPGFITGFASYAIQLAWDQIMHHINIAIRCKKELDALKLLLPRIQAMNVELQEYRKALNSGKMSTSPHHPLPSTVNSWLNELNALLEEASDLAQYCSVRSYFYLFSRYRTSRKIRHLIDNLEKHIACAPSVAFLHQLQQHVANRQVLEQIKERLDYLNHSTSAVASASGDLFPSIYSATSNKKYIEKAVIVGQDSESNRLVELIDSQQHKNVSRLGLVGKGGAGKTLLLKRVFNSDQVQSLFRNDLMLWLTVSQNPSFNTLRDDLVKQISVQVNERLDSREEDHVKTWLNECMRKHKFALFLDDIWETSAASLLEELCVPHSPHHKSNIIIATSRTSSVVSQLGVRPSSLIEMQDLTEDDGWRLFSFYAFPHSDGILPMSIDQEIARSVCKECHGGLPLALKVIGKAMLCFLCLAAFSKGHVIYSNDAIDYWIGKGLVAGRDPLQIGDTYVILLPDRCLIEPIQKDYDGKVICFRVHDVLHDLAQQIAEKEEKCFFQASKGLQEFPMVDCAGHIRISLEENSLTRVPKEIRAPYIRSLLLSSNPSLTEIPKEVIGSMTALRVLDLSRTALQSLPENMGCLKRLVYLGLSFVPLKRLPNSVTALKNLQILDLYRSDITQLPSGISKLTSLKLLDVSFCKHLQWKPYGISRLTSLEYLDAFASSNMQWNKCRRDRLPISDLGTLNKLKRLGLHNNGEIIQKGMLGTMNQVEYLCMHLTVVKLRKLEQLPIVEEAALPSLKTLTIMKCEALQRLPQCYWNLKSVEKIRVYGCSKVLFVMAEEESLIKTKIKVQTITLSTIETQTSEERYHDILQGGEHFYYGEFWCSEMFQLFAGINRFYLF